MKIQIKELLTSLVYRLAVYATILSFPVIADCYIRTMIISYYTWSKPCIFFQIWVVWNITSLWDSLWIFSLKLQGCFYRYNSLFGSYKSDSLLYSIPSMWVFNCFLITRNFWWLVNRIHYITRPSNNHIVLLHTAFRVYEDQVDYY